MFRFNTAGQHLGFCLVSNTTGQGAVGATVAVLRVIDGAAQAPATGIVSEKGSGQYDFAPSAADLTGSQISFLFTASGAVPTEKTVVTTQANPGDSQAFGLGNLDAKVSSRSVYAGGVVAGVTASVTLADKTGFSLGPSGLDAIATARPARGVMPTFPQLLPMLWARYFRRRVYDDAAKTLTGYADDGVTIETLQDLDLTGPGETQGALR